MNNLNNFKNCLLRLTNFNFGYTDIIIDHLICIYINIHYTNEIEHLYIPDKDIFMIEYIINNKLNQYVNIDILTFLNIIIVNFLRIISLNEVILYLASRILYRPLKI